MRIGMQAPESALASCTTQSVLIEIFRNHFRHLVAAERKFYSKREAGLSSGTKSKDLPEANKHPRLGGTYLQAFWSLMPYWLHESLKPHKLPANCHVSVTIWMLKATVESTSLHRH